MVWSPLTRKHSRDNFVYVNRYICLVYFYRGVHCQLLVLLVMVLQKNSNFYSVFQSNGSLFSKGGLQISSESLVLKSPPHLDIDVLVRRFHRSWSKIWVERKESWLSHGVCCPDFLGSQGFRWYHWCLLGRTTSFTWEYYTEGHELAISPWNIKLIW